jgi:NAD(P)-dependent dehydrogenase (short-subunit alcohol dehydrogenase family)
MNNSLPYVLVTGASSGMGKIIAINLSHRYNVVLHGRDEERLNQTKKECNQANDCLIWTFDLTKLDNLEEELKYFMLNNTISIAHFVHCAGYMKLLPIKMISLENLNTSFQTNIFSAALIMKVLTSIKANGKSLKSVVFISSNISNRGAKAFSTYASTKGALDSLMRCLAMELAPRVRVNSVLPGAVKTEMTQAIFDDTQVADKMNKSYPLGVGDPMDIFEIVDFLLSDKSRWITGQQFTVDGGRSVNIAE